MARKRYITTDISLSGKVEELGHIAGEYAIILWTWMIPHLDDWGRMEGESDKVFYNITPRFSKLGKSPDDAEKALQVMDDLDLLQRYTVNEKMYIQVNIDSFYELQTYIPQKKRREDCSKFPPPPSSDDGDKDNIINGIAQSSTEQQKIAKNTPSPSPSPSLSLVNPPIVPPGDDLSKPPKPKPAKKTKNVPYKAIVEAYNEICQSLPKVKEITSGREKAIRARYKQKPELDFFKKLFQKAQKTPFLTGSNDRNWVANFDWLIKENNIAKVLEGFYGNCSTGPPNNTGQGICKGVMNNAGDSRGDLYTPEELNSLVIR